MDPEPMPGDLVELENRLRARPHSEPSAGLRNRVLRAAAEAALPVQSSSPGQSEGWYRLTIAAAVLVAMNLSMIFASQSEFSVRSVSSPNQMATELQALRLIESQQEGQFK
jgi:hypothetical protein